jgi:hypothetical protein
MPKDGRSHLPLCPGRSSLGRMLLQELLRKFGLVRSPSGWAEILTVTRGELHSADWNGTGPSARENAS